MKLPYYHRLSYQNPYYSVYWDNGKIVPKIRFPTPMIRQKSI